MMAVLSEKLPVLENVHPVSMEETLHSQTPGMLTVESDWGWLFLYCSFPQTQRQEEVPRDSGNKSSWEKVLVIQNIWGPVGLRGFIHSVGHLLWALDTGLGFHCLAVLSNHILPYEFLPGTYW